MKLRVFLVGIAAVLQIPLTAVCEEQPIPAERSHLVAPVQGKARLRFAPLTLQGGTKLTLVSPHEWSPLADRLSDSLKETHGFFSRLFGDIPAFRTTLRLMNDEMFYRQTGAPKWTNAMYYRGQIIIPLPENRAVDLDNLFRSIRHEYTHAVVHALSRGKCPGWMDEGIAQWAEGAENPALRPALMNWLHGHRPVPLKALQGGFTKLNPEMVPAAYAQSLYATQSMIRTHGFERIRSYMDSLRRGEKKAKAFKKHFHLSEGAFEKQFAELLSKWKRKDSRGHRFGH